MGKKKHSSHCKKEWDKYHEDSDCYDDVGCKTDSFDPKLHAMLCEKLSFMGPQDKDGFEIVPYKQKPGKRNPGNRLIPKKGEYDPEMVERFDKIFKDYFYATTGRAIDGFKLTPSTHKYVTMMPAARDRNRVLSTLFESRPKIWDLFAGSGADILSYLEELDPLEVVACNKSVPEMVVHGPEYDKSMEDFKVLQGNVEAFFKAYPELRGDPSNKWARMDGTVATNVKLKHTHAHTFILSCPEGSEVDMVYLDPSWDDEQKPGSKDERKYEMEPKELFDHLEEMIWGPIRARKIMVGCYVIKTRWSWLKVQEYLPKINNEFMAMYSVRVQPFRSKLDNVGKYGEVKGVYHFMVLVHKQYKTVNVRNGQLYDDIVRNGTPVWVKRNTVIKVHKPQYSNHLGTPEFTEKDPHNEEEYFFVKPPPPKRPGERVTEERGSSKKRSSYDPNYYRPDKAPDKNRYDVLPQEAGRLQAHIECEF